MLYIQKVKLNLAEQYKIEPAHWVVFWCFKETIKSEFWTKNITLREKSQIS